MEALSTSPVEYEIQHIGCNVCKPPKNEELVQSPTIDISESKSMNSGVFWIILILIILLIVGFFWMRRNNKKMRK
jgi:hypothetical protein